MTNYSHFIRSIMNSELAAAGFLRKSGNWYLSSDEVTAVVNLQKSNYGHFYFVNCGFFVREISESDFPREEHCHVRVRATDLPDCDADRIATLLDFDSDSTADAEREAGLRWIARECLIPFLRDNLSLERLKSTVQERVGFAVVKSAWKVLDYSL